MTYSWSFLLLPIYSFIRWILSLFRGKNALIAQVPRGFSVHQQSLPVKGEKCTYRCGYINEKEEKEFNAKLEERSLYDLFLQAVKRNPTGDCLGERDEGGTYKFENYTTTNKKGLAFGSALVAKLGIKAGNDTRIAIYARNCAKWFISTLGCISQSMVIVPLYDTLGADSANYIVNQCEIQLVVVDTVEKARRLIETKSLMPTLRHIIVMYEEDINDGVIEEGKVANIVIHKMSDILNEGTTSPIEPMMPSHKDIYIISYTSGTTGAPKGVILTHKNLMASVDSFKVAVDNFTPGLLIDSKEVHLSFLPLSHMMEQTAHWVIFNFAGSIGYYGGNILKLGDDFLALRPTFFPVVPRLLNRMYDGIMNKINNSNFIVRALFNLAYNAKLHDLNNGIIQNDSIWDKLVFQKINAALGGRAKIILTGSAPIADEVLNTLKVGFGCVIIEVYGLTETSAVVTTTWPADGRPGHCGGPTSATRIKLADVPDLKYFASEGKGEVLVKGEGITRGYYKSPEKTAELFDEEGFMRTGDIGWIRGDGTIKLIDRKKHIFKLAQGEYVAPEKIESIYTRGEIVQQVYVDGNSLERWLIAVVVPEFAVLQDWNEKTYGKTRSVEEICRDPKAEEFVIAQLQRIGKENKLNSIEQVKKVYLEAEPFSIDNGLLTPTLKAKRPQLREKYNDIISRIYKENHDL